MKYIELKRLSQRVPKFELTVSGNLYHFHFKNSKELTSTFLRFQEFYESPFFKGKVFSLWNFFNYYKKFKNKKQFTYCSDWSGFNLPDYVFKQFKTKLSLREKYFLNSLPKIGKFYVIGTCGNKNSKDFKEVLFHEKAHSLFYLNKTYRKSVKKLIKLKNHKKMVKYLTNLGYNKKVFIDEIQAYLLADYKYLIKENFIDKKDLKLRFSLLRAFNRIGYRT